MIKQSDIFLRSEGRAWWERNKDKIDVANDPILKMIEDSGVRPQRVLEIGCADGWRLKELERRYGCHIQGVEPFASKDASTLGVIDIGTADDLATCFDEDYDLVIYGFCLYLCDREDLFRIAMEGDRVLSNRGHIIIWDFMALHPHKVQYKHKTGVSSFKMNYANLWLGNPAYTSVLGRTYSYDKYDATSVVMLKKDMEAAWPQKSF